MVPHSYLHSVGTEIRSVWILTYCIGDIGVTGGVILYKFLGFEVDDKQVRNLVYGGYSSVGHFGWLKPIVLARGQ